LLPTLDGGEDARSGSAAQTKGRGSLLVSSMKLRGIVGLYVDPPAHAVVLSVHEKSPISCSI
jgi:hypothetical protein